MLLNHRALLFLIYFNQPRPQGFSFKIPGDEVDILITVVSEYRPGAGWGRVLGETRSGTEKRCSHNLQSGHPSWWSTDNYSIFPTVNILEARIEANRQRKSEMLKKLKKIISCNFAFLAYSICLWVLKCGGN